MYTVFTGIWWCSQTIIQSVQRASDTTDSQCVDQRRCGDSARWYVVCTQSVRYISGHKWRPWTSPVQRHSFSNTRPTASLRPDHPPLQVSQCDITRQSCVSRFEYLIKSLAFQQTSHLLKCFRNCIFFLNESFETFLFGCRFGNNIS
jgi:hypothetical protein